MLPKIANLWKRAVSCFSLGDEHVNRPIPRSPVQSRVRCTHLCGSPWSRDRSFISETHSSKSHRLDAIRTALTGNEPELGAAHSSAFMLSRCSRVAIRPDARTSSCRCERPAQTMPVSCHTLFPDRDRLLALEWTTTITPAGWSRITGLALRTYIRVQQRPLARLLKTRVMILAQ